ncbi:DNA primase [Taklimakanibacter lacteus]|uniref:DNA primase n=1 Tax=Taklimakanibacter lacteus TaxID=2268456 RepID=UPI000E6749A2
MKFSPTFLDEIRARVSASSVVGRQVQWDRRKSNPGRGDLWACCPFHNEKTPSFHVDDRKGRYHCFGCKASGDIFTFLTEKEGLSFPEAVERLAQEAGLPMPQVSEEDERREKLRTTLYDVMELAAKFFEEMLQSAKGARARGYLADRGLSVAIQQEFRLGFAPDDRSALRTRLADKGVTVEQMAEAGLVVTGDDIPVAYDRFRDRVMFPIRDPRGRVIAFGGRALSKEAQAKYLNSPETPLFHKGFVLYNLDKARGLAHQAGEIVAVEGYMDAIALHRAGLGHVVAPLGTALTSDQLALLWRIAPSPTLCFDGDAAGLKAAYRALDLALPLLKPGHSLKFALLPEGQDPDDLLKTEGPEAVKAVIAEARPLADILWNREADQARIDTPDGRASFEVRLSSLVREIGDETVRKYYGEDFKARLARHLAPQGGPSLRGFGRGRTKFVPAKPLLSARRGPRARPLPHDYSAPPSEGLRASALAQRSTVHEQERRERLLLLGIINHPELLHDFLDDYAAAEFTSRELDSMKRQIIDMAALAEGLDGPAVKDHLKTQGFGPVLARLESQAARLNEWFLNPGAASADARTALRQMFALHRKSVTLDRELKAAEAQFAADPTEEKLIALNQIREELKSHAGMEAHIEGFGEASGRDAPAF